MCFCKLLICRQSLYLLTPRKKFRVLGDQMIYQLIIKGCCRLLCTYFWCAGSGFRPSIWMDFTCSEVSLWRTDCLNKSIVLMLRYDVLNSHVILPSLALVSCFKTREAFKSSLCKSSWSQKGWWKIFLGVSHDVKVQVYSYLKEKLRSWKYVVCFTDFKVLLMVLGGPGISLPISDTEGGMCKGEQYGLYLEAELRDRMFQLSDCKRGKSLCECSNGHKYLIKSSGPGT